jgi:hypothetical protein
MPMIRVPSHFSWTAYTRCFGELATSRKPVDIQLPITLHNLHFGGSSALLQFVTTWLRSKKNGDLYTFLGSGGAEVTAISLESQIDNFLEHPHALFAARHAQRVLDVKKKEITEVVRARAEFLLQTNRQDIFPAGKGQRFNILCQDVPGASWKGEGLHPFFYDISDSEPPRIRNVGSISSQIKLLLSRQIPESGHAANAQLFDEIGMIVHELMDNTDVWARTELNGTPIFPSYRGMLLHCHRDYSRTAGEIAEQIGGGIEPVTDFLRGSTRKTGQRMLPMLELTVFDCGPTLPARAAQDIFQMLLPANVAEEYDVAIRAFLLWKSSVAELNRGRGLERVLRAITKCGGFLLFRSARLMLYRDLRREPFTDRSAWSATVIPGKHPLRDFLLKGERANNVPRADGTSITFLIPIREA